MSTARKICFHLAWSILAAQAPFAFGEGSSKVLLVDSSRQKAETFIDCLSRAGIAPDFESDNTRAGEARHLTEKYDAVIYSAEAGWTNFKAIEEYVRLGGGLILVSNTPNRDQEIGYSQMKSLWLKGPNPWAGYIEKDGLVPVLLNRLSPSVFVPEESGMYAGYGPTRFGEIRKHPVTEGINFDRAPLLPYHCNARIRTHPIYTGTMRLPWPMEGFHKSIINTDPEEIAWSTNCEKHPLISVCNYGRGRVLLFASTSHDPEFCRWEDSARLWKQAVAWTGANRGAVNRPAEDTVVVLGEDEYRYQLSNFGCRVSDKMSPAGAPGAVVITKNLNRAETSGGTLVWQIGEFDGRSEEFPVSARNAGQYQASFPDDISYNVAGDDWRKSWSGVHFGPKGINIVENPTRRLVRDFRIRFNLDNPAGGRYLLTIALTKETFNPEEYSIEVNGRKRFIRSPRVFSLAIPAEELQPGGNTIVLRLEQGSYLYYDALKLERDVVVTCPRTAEYDLIRRYVESGGNLIVLDPSAFDSDSLKDISPFTESRDIVRTKTDTLSLRNWVTREDTEGAGYREQWYRGETDETGWRPVDTGARLPNCGSDFYRPETWYRTGFVASADTIGREAHLQVQLGVWNGYAYYGSYHAELYYAAQDIIPEIYINGKAVKRSGERWGLRQHHMGIYNLTGLIKEGRNTIAFKTRYHRPYGLDINVQPKLNYGFFANHELAAPCVTFNDEFSSLQSAGDSCFDDYLPGYHLWRTRVFTPRKECRTLLTWEDRQPALVEKYAGKGRILSFTSDVSEHLRFQYGDPPVTLGMGIPNWTRENNIGWCWNSEEVQSHVFCNNYQILLPQPTQLIGALTRYAANRPRNITAVSVDPLARTIALKVKTGDTARQSLKVMYKLFNWENMLIADRSATVALDRNGEGGMQVKLPELLDKTGYGTTSFKDQFLIRIGVDDGWGASADYLEKIVEVNKPVTVSIATDAMMARKLPETLPDNPAYHPKHVQWLSFHEGSDSFIYVPGETAGISVNLKNTTVREQNVRVKTILVKGIEGSERLLFDTTVALAAGQERTFGFQEPLNSDFELYKITAETWIGNSLSDRTERIFNCINPWKDVLDRDKIVHRYGGGIQFSTPYEVVKHLSVSGVPAPDTKPGSDFDEWRAGAFVDMDCDGGSRFDKEYRFNFPWGSTDKKFRGGGLTAVDSCSYLPNGELFNAWFFKDFKPQGTSLVTVDTADFWSYFGLMKTFPNVARFQEWMKRVRKVELAGDTYDEVLKTINDKYLASWYDFSWQSTCWNFAALLTPHPKGSNISQQADVNLSIFDVNTVNLARQASRIIQVGRQDPCLDRVGAGARWRTYTQSAFKGTGPGYHNQNYRTTGFNEPAMGAVGFATGENYQRILNDWVWMTGLDENGNLLPVLDVDTAKTNDFVGSLYGNVIYSMGPYDWVLYDRVFRLVNVIQPQEPIGPVMITRVERVSDGGGNLNYPDEQTSGRRFFESLRNYGVSISAFTSPLNLPKLKKVDGIAYLVPSNLPTDEITALVGLDCPRVLAHTTGRTQTAGTALESLLGLEYNPVRVKEQLRYSTADSQGALYGSGESEYRAAGGKSLLQLSNGQAGIVVDDNARTLFCGLPTDRLGDDTIMRTLCRGINDLCGNPVTFSDGVAGYGFRARGKTFLVLEEMWGQGRPVEIKVKLPRGEYSVVNMNTNDPVASVYERGALVFHPSLRPHEGAMVVVSPKGGVR